MTALAGRRARRFMAVNQGVYPLAEGHTAFEGGMACIDVTDGKCYPGESRTNLEPAGVFLETTDAVGADVPVRVRFPVERWCEWWQNDPAAPVTAAYLFRNCYILDDQSVTREGSGRSVAGRVIALDATKGVLVEWP